MISTWATSLSPSGQRALRRLAVLAAVVGVLLGVETFVLHMTTDPFADTRLYYDAGARLNAGLPLYVAGSEPGVGPYVAPPLLAILFRPLALLPFPVAATIWEGILVVAFLLTVRRIGLRAPVLIALGCLALPILWAISVGQAEVVVMLLLTVGSPFSVALAGHLKVLPWLAAAYWIGRRDGRSLLRLAAWIAVIGVLQLVLEPAGTLAWLRMEWLGSAFDYRIISPFAIHPLLWVMTSLVLLVLAIRMAPGRYGWPVAVALAVLAHPRLLVYQLGSLMAIFGGPTDDTEGHEPEQAITP